MNSVRYKPFTIPIDFPTMDDSLETYYASTISSDLSSVTFKVHLKGIASFFTPGVFVSLFTNPEKVDTLLTDLGKLPLPLLNKLQEHVCDFDARLALVLQERLNKEFEPQPHHDDLEEV